MQLDNNSSLNEVSGRILVVDDDPTARTLHRSILAKQFDVVTASSGSEALDICKNSLPDLVLLDIGMPDFDGIATCRKLRETSSIPIIFATSHESLEEHMMAYDAGGDDLVIKPMRSELLLRKAAVAIRNYRAHSDATAEKKSLQRMAMDFLSNLGQTGILLNFTRASVACRSHLALAQQLLEATSALGVNSSILIRHRDGSTVLTSHGEPTSMERTILEQSSKLGRIFQFQKRLVVNYDRVSILVSDMPAGDEADDAAGRIRDHIATLCETAEALCDNVDMRLESTHRAEQLQIALVEAVRAIDALRLDYDTTFCDVRLLLLELTEKVEKTYSWLETNQKQENAISTTMATSVGSILSTLARQSDLEKKFAHVLEQLRGGSRQNDLELF
jgi:DNA-binding response OmpR family regulator